MLRRESERETKGEMQTAATTRRGRPDDRKDEENVEIVGGRKFEKSRRVLSKFWKITRREAKDRSGRGGVERLLSGALRAKKQWGKMWGRGVTNLMEIFGCGDWLFAIHSKGAVNN